MRTLFQLLIFLASAVACAAQPVKVMTYNIRLDTPVDSINQWPNRSHKVFALLRKYNPDIIGVQEAIHHQLMDLLKSLPEYSYIGVGRDDGKTKGEYSAILYKKDRFSVEAQSTFWLSKKPEIPGSKDWDAAITRVASWGKLRDNQTNGVFLVINTHFDHVGKEARRNSAELVKQKAIELGVDLPVIITGDFNCARNDPPYAAIMKPGGVVLIDPASDAPTGTFCGFKVNSIECRAIDYIFHSSQWVTTNYSVIQDNDGMYYPSDHLPVLATMQLVK